MLAVTDFPDIRLKAAIQSAHEGNILLIPREGGYLVRLYVDLGEIDPNNREAFRLNNTQEKVIETAQRVLRPYTLDVRDVAWFAVYQVGQRVTDRFDDVPADQVGSRLPRVFIAGDACHTHSAKAGQGMNVSMQDTFNLGWKLISVLEGRAKPELLRTYTLERHAIAQGLIDLTRSGRRSWRRRRRIRSARNSQASTPQSFRRISSSRGAIRPASRRTIRPRTVARAARAPRARRPARIPASVSPEPDVARPIVPCSESHSSPSKLTMWVLAPLTVTTPWTTWAAALPAASGSASTSSREQPKNFAISPECGVTVISPRCRGKRSR